MSDPLRSPFSVTSPFRIPWYKDKSYLAVCTLSVVTVTVLSWFTISQNVNGREKFDWAGTGPKAIKRSETNIPIFQQLMEQRDLEEKRSKIRQGIEAKRQAKFQESGHSHEN